MELFRKWSGKHLMSQRSNSHGPIGNNLNPAEDFTVDAVDEKAASEGLKLLTQANGRLVVDEPISDKEKKSLNGFLRPPVEFLLLVADTYDKHPELFGGSFHSASVRNAIAYETANKPIVAEALELASRVAEQIQTRRAAAGQACLNAYVAMKGTSRLSRGAVLRPAVKQAASFLKQGKRAPKAPAPAAPAAASPPSNEPSK